MKILFFTILLSNTSWAQVKVQIVDTDLDSTSLEKDYQVNKEVTSVNSLPDKEVRDELLDDLISIKKWDDLKKDIFFMDLKSKSLKDLSVKYPEVELKSLKFLKAKRD
jgi:hypothetical protein